MKTILLILLFCTQFLSAQTLNDGLVAYYPFNGNANDESGNGHHGNVFGAKLESDRFGNENSAYEFDGIDDYISLGTNNLDIKSNLSISLWINTSSVKEQWALGKYNWEIDAGYHLALIDGIARFNGRDRNNEYIRCIGEEVLNNQQWHHLVAIVNDGIWQLWVDGDFENETITEHLATDLSNDMPLEVGRYFLGDIGDHCYFNGAVDDIKIYNRVISDCEIEMLFNEGICYKTIYDTITTYISADIPQDGLMASYPFNGSANDESENSFHGIANGATLTIDRFGNENSAYEFDGIDDYISLGTNNLDIKSNLSISLWINTSSVKEQWALGKYNWEIDAGYHLSLIDGIARFNGRDRNNKYIRCIGEEVLNNQQWHHLVAIVNDGVWQLWVDGDFENETITEHLATDLSNDMPLEVGRYFLGDIGDHCYFNGVVDDIKIYNRVISDTEIKTLYFEGKTFEEILNEITVYETITHHDTLFYQVYDTITYYDTLYNQVYETITHHDTLYYQVYDTMIVTDTVINFDTITNYIYDSISVTDTLVIDVLISGVEPVELGVIRIYPNPTKDKIYILIDDKIINQNYSIQIVNEIGVLIFVAIDLIENNYEIDISKFGTKGLYFVQILNSNNIVIETKKIILE